MTEQETDAWRRQRLGHVTASRIADVIAKTKSGPSASRANYMAALIAERLTGLPMDNYVNGPMQWGIDVEPEARAAYEFRTDTEVEPCGFVLHPTIAMTGASPDGLVGQNGLVEIKCPLTATHLETMLTGSVAGKYDAQMQWQMACTERQWCDFVSYDPRLPETMRLYVHRVKRDNAAIMALQTEVMVFLAELDRRMAELTQRFVKLPAVTP